MLTRGLIIVTCFVFIVGICKGANAEEVIYEYGFEFGQDGWEIDNGIRELCAYGDTGPPDRGLLYFATACDGNYPTVPDSRLISPEIQLPSPVTFVADEELYLRFWHWFSYEVGDYGYVQISVYDPSTGWSEWADISEPIGNTVSGVWSPRIVNLSSYAEQKVKIAFLHYTDNDGGISQGWFIDTIEIIKNLS